MTDEDLKLEACSRELAALLAAHAERRVIFTAAFVAEVTDIVSQYTALARKSGVRFPDMKVVWSERLRCCEVVRADMEEDGLRMLVRNIAVKYQVRGARGAKWITEMILRAFPHYGRGVDVDEIARRAAASRTQ